MELNYDEKSCGVVVFRKEEGERKYLLLHYPGGHWDFVKGHVEATDENERQTATRELFEETGIGDITFVENFREPISYRYMRRGKPSNKQVVFFLAETTIGEIILSHEHQAHIWLSYESAMKKISFDNSRNVLEKAEKHLN